MRRPPAWLAHHCGDGRRVHGDGVSHDDDEDLLDLRGIDVTGACQQGRRAEVRVRFWPNASGRRGNPAARFLALSWGPMNRPSRRSASSCCSTSRSLPPSRSSWVWRRRSSPSRSPRTRRHPGCDLRGSRSGDFVLYGRSLVSRLVLRPLARVIETADAVADGDLATRCVPAATTRIRDLWANALMRRTGCSTHKANCSLEKAWRASVACDQPSAMVANPASASGYGWRVAVSDGICGLDHASQRAEHQAAHERASIQHENPHFGCHEDHNQDDAALRGDREGELRRRHTHEDREGGKEREVEQQLDAERRLGAIHGTPR